MTDTSTRIKRLHLLIASIQKEASGLNELEGAFGSVVEYGKKEAVRDIASWQDGTPKVFLPGLMKEHQRDAAVDANEKWAEVTDLIRSLRRQLERGNSNQIQQHLEEVERLLGYALLETGGLLAYLDPEN